MSIDAPSTAIRKVPAGFSSVTVVAQAVALVMNGWPKSVRRTWGLSSNRRKSLSRNWMTSAAWKRTQPVGLAGSRWTGRVPAARRLRALRYAADQLVVAAARGPRGRRGSAPGDRALSSTDGRRPIRPARRRGPRPGAPGDGAGRHGPPRACRVVDHRGAAPRGLRLVACPAVTARRGRPGPRPQSRRSSGSSLRAGSSRRASRAWPRRWDESRRARRPARPGSRPS